MALLRARRDSIALDHFVDEFTADEAAPCHGRHSAVPDAVRHHQPLAPSTHVHTKLLLNSRTRKRDANPFIQLETEAFVAIVHVIEGARQGDNGEYYTYE